MRWGADKRTGEFLHVWRSIKMGQDCDNAGCDSSGPVLFSINFAINAQYMISKEHE